MPHFTEIEIGEIKIIERFVVISKEHKMPGNVILGSNFSFYKNAKHFLDSIDMNNSKNTVEKLRSLGIASKEIHLAFINWKTWENNEKST